MKRAIILIICLLAVPGLASAQTTSQVNLVLANQNPFPAEPGSNVELEVSLQNSGLIQATNLAVELMDSYPFSLVNGDKVKVYPTLGAKSSVSLTYTLNVDDSALAGDYDLKFRMYNPSTPNSFREVSLTISVIGETKLILDSVTTSPEKLEPGGRAVLHVKIRNVGTGDAKRTEATMESGSEYIVPVLSGGHAYIGDFLAGETKDVDFTFNIDPGASQETYPATLSLAYRDDSNQDEEVSFPIGIPVVGTVRFEIVSIEPNFNRDSIDIEVANKGTGDAQSVEVRFEVNGQEVGVDYLSQLKATKKTTFSFPLVLSGNAQLVIDYVEPGLAEKSITKDLGPLIFAAPGGTSSYTLVFIIALAVIGYFVYRRYFRKKGSAKR